MKITILTPTYNRAYAIKKLYNSLINQTASNFEWLIVDDGSIDNTKKIIEECINENIIKIDYIYQKNGGKHRALNNGIRKINTEMIFIVDSDDYLKNDAIETINFYHKKYGKDKSICGYSFLRCFEDGSINGPEYKKDEFRSDYMTYRINQKVWGDKAEVFYSEILKKYPFLEVEGEKFLVESYVWAKIALDYDCIYINKPIYVGNYLDDGLTKNMDLKKYESPIGFLEKSKVLCNKKANFYIKCKSTILYIAYSLIAKKTFKEQLTQKDYKALFILLYPLGIIEKVILDKKYKKIKEKNSGR